MSDEIQRTLSLLFSPGDVIELRIPKAGKRGVISGYYDDFAKLANDALKHNGSVPGIYVTLNPVDPRLLARSKNKLQENATSTTSNANIPIRTHLGIDIDPKRPADISSSEEEHRKAIEAGMKLRGWLSSMGWPQGILADSGNGASLIYTISLPNNDESEALVKKVIDVIGFYFDDNNTEIDRKVTDPNRIWKLFGTQACKGENLPERPHRLSKILDAPIKLERVKVEQLKALASKLPDSEPPTQRTYEKSRFDLELWMDKFGILIKSKKSWNGGTVYLLDQCPFDPAHMDASITQLPSGALAFNCFHNSCKNNKWKTLREKFEPGYTEKKGKKKDDGAVSIDEFMEFMRRRHEELLIEYNQKMFAILEEKKKQAQQMQSQPQVSIPSPPVEKSVDPAKSSNEGKPGLGKSNRDPNLPSSPEELDESQTELYKFEQENSNQQKLILSELKQLRIEEPIKTTRSEELILPKLTKQEQKRWPVI